MSASFTKTSSVKLSHEVELDLSFLKKIMDGVSGTREQISHSYESIGGY